MVTAHPILLTVQQSCREEAHQEIQEWQKSQAGARGSENEVEEPQGQPVPV